MNMIATLEAQLAALERAYAMRDINYRTYFGRKDWLLERFANQLKMHESGMRYSSPVDSRIKFTTGRGDKLKLRATTYARTPNRQGAIVLPRSCENVPLAFAEDGEIFHEHDTSRPPLARVMEAKQDGDGIDLVAKWSNSQRARDMRTIIRERARAGKPNYASAGLRIPASGSTLAWVGDKVVNVIDRFTLDEVSLVHYPADDLSIVTSA